MALQILLEKPHISIAYDHLEDWLFVDWHGDQNLESVQDGALAMLRLLASQRTRKVLNDNTRVTSMWSDAAEWGGRVWLPQMVAAGLEYFAWIYSPNVYSRLSTDLTLQHNPSARPVVGTFDDLNTAKAWLRQM